MAKEKATDMLYKDKERGRAALLSLYGAVSMYGAM